MVKKSYWNTRPNILLSDEYNECIGADKTYCSTNNLSIITPFSKQDCEASDVISWWNKKFNYKRNVIERLFAIIKNKYRILLNNWEHKRDTLILAFRVICKLINMQMLIEQNSLLSQRLKKKLL